MTSTADQIERQPLLPLRKHLDLLSLTLDPVG